MHTLLVGPVGHGGEGVYVDTLANSPPDGVTYTRAGDFHVGAPGAPCRVIHEVVLNRVVRPMAVPDIGLRSLHVRHRFDLVHIHAHPTRLSGRRGAPIVMSEGASVAVYLGDYLGWDEERLDRGLRRARRLYRALGITDRLLTLERVAGAYVFSDWAHAINVRWGADPARLQVIPPGFPPQPPIDRSDREHFTFLFAGTDFERKGGFELVEAFAQAARERDDLRLVLQSSEPAVRNADRLIHGWVGEHRRRRGLEMLADLERVGLVRRSQVSRHELMARVYPEADAFVMPTHAEGFGFTNVEAMSFGLPVVTAAAGPAREIVDHGRTGLIVAPGDVAALRDALLRLAADRDAAHEMGESGRARFEARFTLDLFRERLGTFYRDCLEKS